jgi:WD40 repeat protein
VIVWDARSGAVTETLDGHAGQTSSLAISGDVRTLYTGGLDGKVVIWDLTGARGLNRSFSLGRARAASLVTLPAVRTALSNDGRILAVGHDDGRVSLIDVRTLRPISAFAAVPGGPVAVLRYIPHTGLLVVGGRRGFLAIFDPDTGRRVQRLNAVPPRLVTVSATEVGVQPSPSFSADGRVMASTDLLGDVLLWRLRAGRVIGAPRRYGPSLGALDVSLSPDGRTLAVVAVGIEVVDVASLRRRAFLPGVRGRSVVAQFTPDGRYLIGASDNGWTRLWSTKTWQPVGRVLAGHTGEALAASVSPDGRTVATGNMDGTIRLYDLATQELVGAPLPAVPNRPVVPLFTPDGNHLLAITGTGKAYRWDVRPSAWAQRACAVAGRTLTRAEWNDALPGRDYAPACTS